MRVAVHEADLTGNFARADDWNTAQFNSDYKGCILIEILALSLRRTEDSHEFET
jgi:hypothetical protein